MATTFYLRNANIGVAGYRFSSLSRGSASTNLVIATVNDATDISGAFFSTRPLSSFTLSGSVTVSTRAQESAPLANAAMRYRLYRWSPLTGLSGAILTLTQGVELGTTEAAVSLTGTPTTTLFNSGDALVLEIAITNIGTMNGGGRSVTVSYNGATSGAAGDSFFTITENIVQKQRAYTTG